MKESYQHSKGTVNGEVFAQAAKESLSMLPLTDSRVQVFLAQRAFPGEIDAIEKWIEGDGDETSLSSRFRAYIEDSARTSADASVDIQNTEALSRLLDAVRAHAPESTRH